MHFFPPHLESLTQAIQSRYPLIILGQTSRSYLLKMLSELIESKVLEKVDLFEECFGLSRLKKEVLCKKKSPELDSSSYLRRLSTELDYLELQTSQSFHCLCLFVPDEVIHQAEFVASLSALCLRLTKQRSFSLIVSSDALIPKQLSEWVKKVNLSTPKRNAIGLTYLEHLLVECNESLRVQTEKERQRVAERLMTRVQGLDAPSLCTVVFEAHEQVESNATAQDLTAWEEQMMHALLKIKANRLRRSVGLELQPLEDFNSDELAGMEQYKRYLDYMSVLFQHHEDRNRLKIAPPKGVLLVGLPGCGKSLAAKLTASRLNLPLLRLELDAIMGRYLGESEHNLIKALKTAEAAAPCVLWIDELDKALGGLGDSGSGSGGTGQRILGRLLTWMQEQKAGVYLFATANRVGHLPPELLRRGRFDELWKVMLPTDQERKAIINQKLRFRGQSWDEDTMNKAVNLTQMYTGADIESLITETQIRAFCGENDDLSYELFAEVNKGFTPLSSQFSKQIEDETKALDEHGFRDVSGTEYLPPEVNFRRRVISSKELSRLCHLSIPLRFHFGETAKSGWTLQIEQNGTAIGTDGWIEEDKIVKSDNISILQLDGNQLSISPPIVIKHESYVPPMVIKQESYNVLVNEGGYLLAQNYYRNIRLKEKRRFEIPIIEYVFNLPISVKFTATKIDNQPVEIDEVIYTSIFGPIKSPINGFIYYIHREVSHTLDNDSVIAIISASILDLETIKKISKKDGYDLDL